MRISGLAAPVLVAVVVAAACGSKKEPAGGSAAPPVAALADAAAAAATPDAAAPPRAKPAPITKAVRAEYKQRLSAGRKAAKATRWSDATTEFEAALVAIPGDDRALGELSWAAFSAGDHDRARKAGRASVLAATDPKIKAASLYNLGRVEEAGSKIAEAAVLYRQSLALRPNKIVEDRLAKLGKDGAAVAAALPCTTPATEAALCACLDASVERDEPDAAACTLAPAGAPDFQIATFVATTASEQEMVLVARQAAGWAVVAHLGYVYNPGMMGISEEWSLTETKEETLGGKQVVRFAASKSRSDTDMGVDEFETENHESLVVCVRGAADVATTCPLDVLTSYTYLRDRLGVAEDEDMKDVADLLTKGLPIRTELAVSVELGADGIAKVRAVRGNPESSTLGDKKLW